MLYFNHQKKGEKNGLMGTYDIGHTGDRRMKRADVLEMLLDNIYMAVGQEMSRRDVDECHAEIEELRKMIADDTYCPTWAHLDEN